MNLETLIVDGRLLGIDAITKLGGVNISGAGKVHFLAEELAKCTAIEIHETLATS